jgi:hypothetical protein
VYLKVENEVARLTIVESGNLQDAAGKTFSFSTSQTVSPP